MREMKDSGIPWVGKVPPNWKIMPNKYLMHKVKKICPTYNGESILSLTMQGVVIRDFELGGKMPATFDGYQIIYPGNLLMCLFDYDVTPRCIGLVKDKGLTSPAYSQFVMNKGADARYYYYYYLLLDFTKELLHLAKNLRHSFTEEQLGKIKVPVPPIQVQHRIADYLDTKCSQIASIRKNVESEIEALKQYKQSVITETVTKGLDKDVEMKDSGIPWIGKIPKDWEIKRLKYACNKISDGTHFSPATVDNGYPYLTAKDIQGLTIDFEKAQKVSDDDFFKLKKSGCCPQKGDVLIVKDGATTGRTGMMLKKIECVLLSSVAMMHVNNFMNNFFLWYFLQSKSMQKQIESSMAGSAITRITLAKLSNFVLTCPSLKEQQRIADFLDAKCARIDSIIQKKQELLTNLDTYKKSLIYEYVTGKKEVPAV